MNSHQIQQGTEDEESAESQAAKLLDKPFDKSLFDPGSEVTEQQIRSLFGKVTHNNDELVHALVDGVREKKRQVLQYGSHHMTLKIMTHVSTLLGKKLTTPAQLVEIARKQKKELSGIVWDA